MTLLCWKVKQYRKYDERSEEKRREGSGSNGAGSAEVEAEDICMHRYSLSRRPVAAPRQADPMNARPQNALISVIIAKTHMHSSSKLLLKRREIARRNPVKRNKSQSTPLLYGFKRGR